MKKLLLFVCSAAALLTLPGCLTADHTTQLDATGNMKRTLRFAQSDPMMSDDTSKAMEALKARIKLDGGWKLSEGKTTQELYFTAEKSTPAGVSGEYRILTAKGKEILVVIAKTEKQADGTIVFTETYRWLDEAVRANGLKSIATLAEAVKKEFPELKLTDNEAQGLSASATQIITEILFGPTKPKFISFLAGGRSGERELRALSFERMGPVVDALRPNLDPALRRRVMLYFTLKETLETAAPSATVPDPASPAPAEPGEEGSGQVRMFSLVEFPGKVIETNGLIDPVDGAVSFELFDSAVVFKDQVFRVVYRP